MPLERAAEASEVAGVERFKHQHHWIALVAFEPVSDLMRDRIGRYVHWKSHIFFSLVVPPSGGS